MDPVDGLSFAGGDPARGADAIFRAHGGTVLGGTLTRVPTEGFASTGDLGATWGGVRFVRRAGASGVAGRYVPV